MSSETQILNFGNNFIPEVLMQLIATAILCFLLFKILYKPVVNFLDKRKQKIESEIKQASEKLSKADEFKIMYEVKLKEIEKEKNDILEKARNDAKQNEVKIIEEAKKEADLIKQRALTDIEREQEKIKEEIKNQIIEVSILIANKFINKNISEEEQKFFLDNAIAELEEIKW